MLGSFSGSRSPRVALALAAAIICGTASAGESKIALSGQEETPPVTTAAKGDATISVSKDRKLTGTVTTSGVEGTVAHIHAGGPGEKGPPVVTLTSTAPNVWSVPSDTVLTEEQYASYLAGKLYINIHSAANKGGEIRGQIKP